MAGVAAVAALVVAGVVRAALGVTTRKFYTIESGAMAPTLQVGDRVACTKKVPARVPRGAVVTFRFEGSAVLVERVVGLPGETVSVDRGAVTIDGAPLDETYADTAEDTARTAAVRLPERSYFLLGDRRGRSSDSRVHGPVAHDAIQAVCTEITAPRERRGRIPGT